MENSEIDNNTRKFLERLQEQESLENFHTNVLLIGSICIAIVGVITNMLSLIVLCRRDMRATTYVFLIGLAISDMTVILTGTLLCCLTTFVNADFEILSDDQYLPAIFPFLRPAASSCVFVSIWITVALSADRYLAVCHHQMRINTCCTVPRARKITAAIFVASVLYNVPTFFEYKVDFVFIPQLNQTMAVYGVTKLGANAIYRQIYHTWLTLPIMFGLPFISLAFMNIRLVMVVLQSRRHGRALGDRRAHGLDITLMLIAVVVVFLLLHTPNMVSTVLWAVAPGNINGLTYMKFSMIAVLFVLINSSTNFFVYTLCGKRFRRKFQQVICNCSCKGGDYHDSTPSHDPLSSRRLYST